MQGPGSGRFPAAVRPWQKPAQPQRTTRASGDVIRCRQRGGTARAGEATGLQGWARQRTGAGATILLPIVCWDTCKFCEGCRAAGRCEGRPSRMRKDTGNASATHAYAAPQRLETAWEPWASGGAEPRPSSLCGRTRTRCRPGVHVRLVVLLGHLPICRLADPWSCHCGSRHGSPSLRHHGANWWAFPARASLVTPRTQPDGACRSAAAQSSAVGCAPPGGGDSAWEQQSILYARGSPCRCWQPVHTCGVQVHGATYLPGRVQAQPRAAT